ncbi:MAG: hypothetical protein PHW95_02175 [Patescibacteria group bacterium]|nr:hypothetical protein [Patescibacteria group bacterium]
MSGLERLKLTGRVELLPSGFYSSVVLVVENGHKKVVKLIRKPELNEQAIAQQLGDDIVAYGAELLRRGVRSPQVKVRLLGDVGEGWDVVVEAPFQGTDVAHLLLEADESDSVRLTRGMLGMISALFDYPLESGFELQIGIDPKPDNFTVSETGEMHYIDLMPPRYRRDGVPIVEFPEPTTDIGKKVAYYRYYDMRGILTVLRSQLCRNRFDLRPLFRRLIAEFAAQYPGLGRHMGLSVGEVFVDANLSGRLAIIEALAGDDMYAMRDIVTQLAFENPLYRHPCIDKVFHLSHFYQEAPSPENVCRVKKILRAMTRNESVEV